MPIVPICPYCGNPSVWMQDAKVYGRSYGGYVYACLPCDAFVGCHKQGKNNETKGTLANKDLRDLRCAAHRLFDPMWKVAVRERGWSKSKARRIAYAWLARELGLSVENCHIGHLRDDDVKRVITACIAVYDAAVERLERDVTAA